MFHTEPDSEPGYTVDLLAAAKWQVDECLECHTGEMHMTEADHPIHAALRAAIAAAEGEQG